LSKHNTDIFKFIINYDANYISLRRDFMNITIDLKENFLWLNDFKFNLLYSTNDNLNNIFIINEKNLILKKKCSKQANVQIPTVLLVNSYTKKTTYQINHFSCLLQIIETVVVSI